MPLVTLANGTSVGVVEVICMFTMVLNAFMDISSTVGKMFIKVDGSVVIVSNGKPEHTMDGGT